MNKSGLTPVPSRYILLRSGSLGRRSALCSNRCCSTRVAVGDPRAVLWRVDLSVLARPPAGNTGNCRWCDWPVFTRARWLHAAERGQQVGTPSAYPSGRLENGRAGYIAVQPVFKPSGPLLSRLQSVRRL